MEEWINRKVKEARKRNPLVHADDVVVKSPAIGVVLKHHILYPNLHVKQQIQEYRRQHWVTHLNNELQQLATDVICTSPLNPTDFTRAVEVVVAFFEKHKGVVWLKPNVVEAMSRQTELVECPDEQRIILNLVTEIGRTSKQTLEQMTSRADDAARRALLSRKMAERTKEELGVVTDELRRAHSAVLAAFKAYEDVAERAKDATDKSECMESAAQVAEEQAAAARIDGFVDVTEVPTVEECVASVLRNLAEEERRFHLSGHGERKGVALKVSHGVESLLQSLPQIPMPVADEVCSDALGGDPLALALCCTLGLHGFSNHGGNILVYLLKLYADSREVQFAMYLHLVKRGLGLTQDGVTKTHLMRAAEDGLPCAQYMMSQCTWLAKSEVRAWVLKACAQEHPAAMVLCALWAHGGENLLYDRDNQQPYEPDEALKRTPEECYKLMLEASKRGNRIAHLWLGDYLLIGYGIERNVPRARIHFREAARASRFELCGDWTYGVPEAMWKYALALYAGYPMADDVKLRFKESTEWMFRASRLSCGDAMKHIEAHWRNMAREVIEEQEENADHAEKTMHFDISNVYQCALMKQQVRFNTHMALSGFDASKLLQHEGVPGA